MAKQSSPNSIVLSAVVVVQNKHGLHMRCASELALLARSFDCKVFIKKGRYQVDAASPLEIVTLTALPNSELTILASGNDAEKALAAFVDYFATQLRD